MRRASCKAGRCGVQVRDWLCPINRRWNLASLLGCLQQAYPRDLVTRAAATRKFVLIEYVMLHRINDTVEDAYRCLCCRRLRAACYC